LSNVSRFFQEAPPEAETPPLGVPESDEITTSDSVGLLSPAKEQLKTSKIVSAGAETTERGSGLPLTVVPPAGAEDRQQIDLKPETAESKREIGHEASNWESDQGTPQETDLNQVARAEPPCDGALRDVLTTLPEAKIANYVWIAMEQGRLGLAYHLAETIERLHPELNSLYPPSALIRSIILATLVRIPGGEIVDLLATNYHEVLSRLPEMGDADRNNLYLVFAATLRPALLAPVTEAAALLEMLPPQRLGVLSALRQSILDFTRLGVELSPAILKGIHEGEQWEQCLEQVKTQLRAWREQARKAQLVYAPATNVWRHWLEPEGAIGQLIATLLEDPNPDLEEFRERLAKWKNDRDVVTELTRTDKALRKRAADRRPIEARAKNAIIKHVREAVAWLERLASTIEQRPASMTDFVYREVQNCRRAVLSGIENAESVLGEMFDSAQSAETRATVSVTRGLLKDLATLFSLEEVDSTVPTLFNALNADLLRVPGLTLNEEGEQENLGAKELLPALINLAENPPRPWREVFRVQCQRRNRFAAERPGDCTLPRTTCR